MLVGISIVFLAVAIGIITIIPCPSEPQFLFYKVVLAISVSGIASIIPGFINIKYKGLVSASGAIAVFVFVLTYNPAFIKDNPRCRSTFDLDVQFYGDSAKGTLINSGDVRVILPGQSHRYTIQEGRIILEEVPIDIIGQPIVIIPQLEDYKKEQISVTLTHQVKSVDLVLTPIKHTTRIEGSVFRKNKPVENGIVNINGTTVNTDKFGSFSMDVPVKEGTMVNIKILEAGNLVFDSTEPASSSRKQIFVK